MLQKPGTAEDVGLVFLERGEGRQVRIWRFGLAGSLPGSAMSDLSRFLSPNDQSPANCQITRLDEIEKIEYYLFSIEYTAMADISPLLRLDY